MNEAHGKQKEMDKMLRINKDGGGQQHNPKQRYALLNPLILMRLRRV